MNNALAPTLIGDDSSITVFRPTPWLWLPVVLYTAVQGSLLHSMLRDGGSLRMEISLVSIVFLPICVLAIYTATAQVRVDEETLQWRTCLGWNRVPWRDVLDYFELSRRDKSGIQTSCAVLTPIGRCLFYYGGILGWKNGSLLRRAIQKRAVKARTTQWEMLGARPEIDWPKTFEEGSFLTVWIIPAAFFVIGLFCAGVCIKMVMWYSHQWVSLAAGREEEFMLLVPIGFECVLCLAMLTEAVRMVATRRKRRITISIDGIVYSDPKRNVKAAWSEVTRIKTLPLETRTIPGNPRTSVETTQGTFDFLWTTCDYYALKTCLRLSVAPSVAEDWESSGTNEQLRRRVDRLQANTGIYGYRTSSFRTVLFALTTIPVACCVSVIFHFSPDIPVSFTLLHGGIIALAILPTLVGWLLYFTTRIVIDDAGITSQTLFRKKSISWPDVQRVEVSGAEPFRRISIIGPNARISYLSFIADGEQLVNEIERRTGIVFPE